MEFLKAQTDYISQQLRTLNLSQRIAIGLLVVVLFGGMYQMMQWAGRPEWTPLLGQALSADQIQRIQGQLAVAGVEMKVDGDRVLIRGDDEDRQRVQAALAQSGAMPADTSLGYEAIVKDTNAFMSNKRRVWIQDRGLETELSSVLSNFDGIQKARVFIDRPQKRGFGKRDSGTRASVNVVAGGGAMDQNRIDAIAHLVSGAVRGLAVSDVKITDGSKYYRPSDPNNRIPMDLLEKQRAEEDHYTQKLYDQFHFIQGLVVNVHAKLRDDDVTISSTKLGPPVVSDESEKTEESLSGSAAAGPGVRPNQGNAIGGGDSGTSLTKSDTKTTMGGDRDSERTNTVRLPGFLERLTASISVPDSYLSGLYRKQQGLEEDADVTHEQIEAIAKVELTVLLDSAKTLLQATDDDQVAVSWHYDMPMVTASGGGMAGASAAADLDYLALAKRYGPLAGLGLLALFSLFVVFRIAKKAQAAVGQVKTSAADADRSGSLDDEESELQMLGGGPTTVGQAAGMQGALVGHEVDEGLVKTQQIVEQIGQLVKEDADSAAGILNGWLQEQE